jgi:fructan beta-fructosidase
MIAWMNNWKYALFIPSDGQRGVFSLVRELSLVRMADGIRLIQKPIAELQTLRDKHEHWQEQVIQPDTNILANVRGIALEIIAEFKITDKTESFGFRVRVGENEHTGIRYSAQEKCLSVDRSHSGQIDFNDDFGAIYSTDLLPIDDTIRLHIFVDSKSVEVFANDGIVTFTDSIFPDAQSQGVELFAEGGEVILQSLDIFHIHPAEFQIEEDKP